MTVSQDLIPTSKMTQSTSSSSLTDYDGEFEENNSARILRARTTTKDDEDSTLAGVSSPEEYFYDSLEEGNSSRLSNNTIGSEALVEKKPSVFGIPTERPRAVAWTISLTPTGLDDEHYSLGETSPRQENTYNSFEDGNNFRHLNTVTIAGSETQEETERTISETYDELPRTILETEHPAITIEEVYSLDQASSPTESICHYFEEGLNTFRPVDTGKLRSKLSVETERAVSGISDELPRAFPGTLHPAVIIKDKGDNSLDLTPTPRENTYHLFKEGNKFGQLDTDKLRKSETSGETSNPVPGKPEALPRVIPDTLLLDFPTELPRAISETSLPGTPAELPRAISDTLLPEFPNELSRVISEASLPGIPTELHGNLPVPEFPIELPRAISDASLPGISTELHDTFLPPVAFRDYDDNHLDETASPKENTRYLFEEKSNSKQMNTARSESPVIPTPQRPAEMPASTSWTIPFGITTHDNDKFSVNGTSSPSQTFNDALVDVISSGPSNKSIILGSKIPLKKKLRASRIPRRQPGANTGTRAPIATERISRKPSRIPKPTLQHYPHLNVKKTRASKIPILRNLQLARKTTPSSKWNLPLLKRAKASRIPIRISRPASKPSPSNKDRRAHYFQKSKQTRNTTKPGNNWRRSDKPPKQQPTARKSNDPKKPTKHRESCKKNSEKALKRPQTGKKNTEFINQKKRSNTPVSADKAHYRQKENTLTPRNDKQKLPNEDQTNNGTGPDTDKAIKMSREYAGYEEVHAENKTPANECRYHLDISTQVQNASLSPVLKIQEPDDEGKLSPNTVRLSILQGMKSIVKEVEEIKNKIETFDKITNAGRTEEAPQQVPSKHAAKSKHSVIAEIGTTPVALDVENRDKDELSEFPDTGNKIADTMETESHDSKEKKSSRKTKSKASQKGSKESKTKAARAKSEADHIIGQKSTTETDDICNVESMRTPRKAKRSTPEENVWERLAKKPTRSIGNGNDKPDKIKRNSEAKAARKQTGAETKPEAKKTPKSETTNVRRKPKSPDCTMLANATDIFASGLRFHKSESPKDKDKRSKTNFDLAKDKYLRLLEQTDENDTLIEDNEKKIEQQESELDNAYEEAHRYIVDIAQSTSGVVEARKIHCNFKDEAARLRVLHKTNLIAADIYEADTTILQGRITELQQEIKETKAINHLDPCELKEKIQDILACRSDQRDTNRQIETQIKRLRDRLNVLKCGDMLQDDEPDTCTSEDKQIDVERGTYERIYVKAETMEGVMVNTHDETEVVIGSSRSADAVSENKVKPPRETKSDQDQSPREDESVLVHKRALLHRRKSSAERLRNVMKSTDQVECPLGEGDQISPRQLPPLLLPSKQSPDEPMPTYGVRHPTWPRPSYLSGQLPGFHVPLPPLHPRIDDGFPKTTNPLPHQPMFPRPFEREIPTPAIRTPLPSICSGQSDGDNTMPDHSPHPPLSPNLPPINRPKTGIRRKPV